MLDFCLPVKKQKSNEETEISRMESDSLSLMPATSQSYEVSQGLVEDADLPSKETTTETDSLTSASTISKVSYMIRWK